MNYSLELKNISKRFNNVEIYRAINHTFKAGCYSINGANGIGKSVLLNMLAGVSKQDSGLITLQNSNTNQEYVSTSIEYKRRLVYVPSKPSFFPHATGEDFLQFVYSVKPERSADKVNELIEGFDLKKHLKTRFCDMSLGTQKKLFLTTLGMGNNQVIIMDEPSNALDTKSRQFLSRLIQHYSIGAIVILATHDLDLLTNLSQQEILLECQPVTMFSSVKKIG